MQNGDIPQGCCEHLLQECWNALPSGTSFRLADGRTCTVVKRGIWNHGPGPDFTDAVIRIGNEERRGDIELHRKTTDWVRHGHGADERYANVMLHAVAENDADAASAALLPEIPCLVLPRRKDVRRTDRTFCADFFAGASDGSLRRFMESAGLDRMRRRAGLILRDCIRSGTWRAFLFRLMELLGMPSSRRDFSFLAEKVASYPDDVLKEHYPAILWGESGLLPDPAAVPLAEDAENIVRELWKEWWKLRPDAAQMRPVRSSARPLNSPERRIAAAALFTQERVEELLRRTKERLRHGAAPFSMTKDPLFEGGEPFWETHISFTAPPLKRKTALIGTERHLLLLTDLAVPFLHACFSLNHEEELLAPLEQAFLSLPKTPDNRILRIMEEQCFPGGKIPATAAARQGVLHLYKTFCGELSFQCGKCPLRNSVTM